MAVTTNPVGSPEVRELDPKNSEGRACLQSTHHTFFANNT